MGDWSLFQCSECQVETDPGTTLLFHHASDSHKHTHSYWDNFGIPVTQRYMFWGCGREPEYPETSTRMWGEYANSTATVAPARGQLFFLINVVTNCC